MSERLGVGEEVYASVDNGELVIRPSSNLLDEMAKQVRFNFTGVERALPRLKGRHTTAAQGLWLRGVPIEMDILLAALNPSDPLREYALRGLNQENLNLSPYSLLELYLLVRAKKLEVRDHPGFAQPLIDS